MTLACISDRDIQHWHFLKSTGDMGTPRQGPLTFSTPTPCGRYDSRLHVVRAWRGQSLVTLWSVSGHRVVSTPSIITLLLTPYPGYYNITILTSSLPCPLLLDYLSLTFLSLPVSVLLYHTQSPSLHLSPLHLCVHFTLFPSILLAPVPTLCAKICKSTLFRYSTLKLFLTYSYPQFNKFPHPPYPFPLGLSINYICT